MTEYIKMQPVKIFTTQEANQTLPFVKKVVADILSLGHQIRALSTKIGSDAQDDPEIIRLMDQLEELFEELESIGCSYKDWNFSVGLVDFPCVIDEKDVFLCWRCDEDELRYYHEIDSGFAGRKPIPKKYLFHKREV